MEAQTDSPGARLALLMRRRGWSAPRLAGMAGGVSASSIRAYVADRTTPRPSHALALANALGPADGKGLLVAWGFNDLAEGFHGQWGAGRTEERLAVPVAQAVARLNRVEPPDEPLSGPAAEVVRALAAWMQHLEQGPAAPGPGVRPRRGSAQPEAGRPS